MNSLKLNSASSANSCTAQLGRIANKPYVGVLLRALGRVVL